MKKLILLFTIVFLFSSCNKENFEKIRMNPNVDFRYEKAFEYYNAGDYQRAQYLFEDLMGLIKLSEKAEKVYYHYAMTHYKLKGFVSSSYYFKQFYNTFPNSVNAEESLFLSAESFANQSPIYRLAQEETVKAIDGYQLFVNTYPASERVSISNEKITKLRQKLEEKELENAKGYFKRRDYVASTHCFRNLLVDFPDTKNVEFIRYMIVKSSYWYAKQSILDKQIERFNTTIQEFEYFRKKFSNSLFIKELENYYNFSKDRIKYLKNE